MTEPDCDQETPLDERIRAFVSAETKRRAKVAEGVEVTLTYTDLFGNEQIAAAIRRAPDPSDDVKE